MSIRDYNVGSSDYSTKKIQPWDIWLEYDLDPWRADIIKRILRNKEGEDKRLDLEKVKHICDELIRQLDTAVTFEQMTKAPTDRMTPFDIVNRDVPDGCELSLVNEAGHIFLVDANNNALTFEHFNEFEKWAKEYRK